MYCCCHCFVAAAVVFVVLFFYLPTSFYMLYTGAREGTSPLLSFLLFAKFLEKSASLAPYVLNVRIGRISIQSSHIIHACLLV